MGFHMVYEIMVYCKVLTPIPNSKLDYAQIYCRKNICCAKDFQYPKYINKCGNNKKYCCPEYRKCILKATLSDRNGNPTLINFTTPKTPEYNPQQDIRSTNQSTEQTSNNQSNMGIQPLPSYSQLHFENTNVSVFNFQLRNNSHSNIQIPDSDIEIPYGDIQRSDYDIQRSDYNIERSDFDIEISDSDIQIPDSDNRRSDSDIRNDEDTLPSYEESLQLSPVSVSPPSYAEE